MFIGCKRMKNVAHYANYALFKLSYAARRERVKIPLLEDPESYATSLKQSDGQQYLGYVAWGLNYLNMTGTGSEDKQELGRNVLQELVEANASRPEAYIALWQVDYKDNKD